MTVKETAGGVLLVLYRENIQNPLAIDSKGFEFRYNESDQKDKAEYDEFETRLLLAANNDIRYLLNALRYLIDANLIHHSNNGSSMSELVIRDLRLTDSGFDLIEGVERKEADTKSQFNLTFNFKLESVAKIDSILRTKFGLVNL